MAFRNVQAGMVTYRGQGRDRGDAYYAHPTNAGPHPGISRLRSCSPDAGDLPAIGGRAEGDAIRHDVRSVHVCEGLPSAGFLAVARFPWLSSRVAGSRAS
jgi:hypothetical protein